MSYVLARSRGLGDQGTALKTTQIVSSIGAPVATAGISSALSVPTAAGGTAILGMAPALAIPIIGAALAAVSIGVMELIKNSGCGPTCIQASNYANEAEPLLQQNLKAYLAQPAPRSESSRAQALANFAAIWQKAVSLWSDPSLGNAGKRGIEDRQQGACHYQTSPGGWSGTQYTYPGPAGSGSTCWNWFVGYRDPIASDPNVVPDGQHADPAGISAVTGLPSWLWLAAAALGLWWVLS